MRQVDAQRSVTITRCRPARTEPCKQNVCWGDRAGEYKAPLLCMHTISPRSLAYLHVAAASQGFKSRASTPGGLSRCLLRLRTTRRRTISATGIRRQVYTYNDAYLDLSRTGASELFCVLLARALHKAACGLILIAILQFHFLCTPNASKSKPRFALQAWCWQHLRLAVKRICTRTRVRCK